MTASHRAGSTPERRPYERQVCRIHVDSIASNSLCHSGCGRWGPPFSCIICAVNVSSMPAGTCAHSRTCIWARLDDPLFEERIPESCRYGDCIGSRLVRMPYPGKFGISVSKGMMRRLREGHNLLPCADCSFCSCPHATSGVGLGSASKDSLRELVQWCF